MNVKKVVSNRLIKSWLKRLQFVSADLFDPCDLGRDPVVRDPVVCFHLRLSRLGPGSRSGFGSRILERCERRKEWEGLHAVLFRKYISPNPDQSGSAVTRLVLMLFSGHVIKFSRLKSLNCFFLSLFLRGWSWLVSRLGIKIVCQMSENTWGNLNQTKF